MAQKRFNQEQNDLLLEEGGDEAFNLTVDDLM